MRGYGLDCVCVAFRVCTLKVRGVQDTGPYHKEAQQTAHRRRQKTSPRFGQANKLHKRAEVLLASHANQNIGTAEEEAALRSQQQSVNPKRLKAGR